VGVKPSLEAFAIGYERAGIDAESVTPADPRPKGEGKPVTPGDPQIRALIERIDSAFPAGARSMLIEGARRLVDYQDPAYAQLYLDRLARISRPAHGEPLLLQESARHLALWMSYEDTIRVAELKTRATRFERVRGEVRVNDDQLLA